MKIPFSIYFRVFVVPMLLLMLPELIWILISIVRSILKKKGAWFHLVIAVFFLIESVFFFSPTERSTAIRLLKDIGAQTCCTEGIIIKIEDGGLYEHATYQGWIISTDSDSESFFVFADNKPQIGRSIRIEYLPNSRTITSMEFEEDKTNLRACPIY